jgi:hypothetical protein
VGPRAGVDTEARGKILSPLPGIEPRSPGRPSRSQTLYCLNYRAHVMWVVAYVMLFCALKTFVWNVEFSGYFFFFSECRPMFLSGRIISVY